MPITVAPTVPIPTPANSSTMPAHRAGSTARNRRPRRGAACGRWAGPAVPSSRRSCPGHRLGTQRSLFHGSLASGWCSTRGGGPRQTRTSENGRRVAEGSHGRRSGTRGPTAATAAEAAGPRRRPPLPDPSIPPAAPPPAVAVGRGISPPGVRPAPTAPPNPNPSRPPLLAAAHRPFASRRTTSAAAPPGSCRRAGVRCGGRRRGAVRGTAAVPGTAVAAERGSRVRSVAGRRERGEGAHVGALVAQGGPEGAAARGRGTQLREREPRVGRVEPAGVAEVAEAQAGAAGEGCPAGSRTLTGSSATPRAVSGATIGQPQRIARRGQPVDEAEVGGAGGDGGGDLRSGEDAQGDAGRRERAEDGGAERGRGGDEGQAVLGGGGHAEDVGAGRVEPQQQRTRVLQQPLARRGGRDRPARQQRRAQVLFEGGDVLGRPRTGCSPARARPPRRRRDAPR